MRPHSRLSHLKDRYPKRLVRKIRHPRVSKEERMFTGPFRFNDLPPEIRQRILEEICRDRFPGWSKYANVCSEWNDAVASANFKRLKVDKDTAVGLHGISNRHMQHVRHILITVELPSYTAACCSAWDPGMDVRSGTTFQSALEWLFWFLQTWRSEHGIVLEIALFCRADSEHCFKYLHVNSDGPIGSDVQISQANDPTHGWFRGRQQGVPPLDFFLYPFDTPLDRGLDSPYKLRNAPAVTGLVIRRQFRRQLGSTGLQALLTALPNLTSFTVEPWRGFKQGCRTHDGVPDEFADTLKNSLPRHIKSVTIFESMTRQLVLSAQERALGPEDGLVELHDLNSGLQAAKSILKKPDLEHLSIAFRCDIRHILRARKKLGGDTLRNLETLAMTSVDLLRDHSIEERSKLYIELARFLKASPKLRTMVLWCGRRGQACAVIYDRAQATLTMRSNWGFRLRADALEAWEKAVPVHLRVHIEQVTGRIEGPGNALSRLNLPKYIVDPISLWQMCQEEKIDQMDRDVPA